METRSVLVTGASTGIGHATVTALTRDGFRTWATVRRQPDADRLSAELGDAVTPLLVDLEDEESVRAAGRRVCADGPLHGLVNNAGAALSGPLELLPIATFRRQLEINLVGQLLMTQVMLPALLDAAGRHGDARVVMVGSIGGRIAGPTLGAYQAAKHGLVGLTGALRAELAPSHIRVVLVEPGVIATPIWASGRAAGEHILHGQPDEVVRRYEKQLQGARAMAERGQRHGLPAEVPARVIHAALTAKNPRPRQTVGRDAAVVAAMVRLLPFRLLYRLTAGRA
jgi:NAD(P)-dependent dehydrogenase (short-subunit alcohol dehydrogenase family)